MKNYSVVYSLVVILLITLLSCKNKEMTGAAQKIRPLKDTVGFAQYPWQMDSLMAR